MRYLLFVTVLWAFSFNLIGEYLAGQVDSYFAVLTRVLLAGLVFLPLTRWRGVEPRFVGGVMLVGALQFGITYVCLYLSFNVLTVPEVLLFTVLTPVHVALFDDLLNRRFNFWALAAALVAVLGAAIIRYDGITGEFLQGFLLLQLANATFAAGQVLYKRLVRKYPSELPQRQRFGYFFVGALLVALPAWLLFGDPQRLPAGELQWGVLVWMGLLATALGQFWWNKGATEVDAGTLAVMNNLHVPVGLLLNLLIWNQHADLPRLALGGAVIVASLWVNRLGRRECVHEDFRTGRAAVAGRLGAVRYPAGLRPPAGAAGQPAGGGASGGLVDPDGIPAGRRHPPVADPARRLAPAVRRALAAGLLPADRGDDAAAMGHLHLGAVGREDP